jgi:uncharacterized protein YciI
MNQYVIYAFDGTDEEALARRMAARPLHLDVATQLKANHNFIVGGAMLDETGKMVGSTMIVQFETKEAFDAWFSTDPYITMNVWQKIEVHPFRVANI